MNEIAALSAQTSTIPGSTQYSAISHMQNARLSRLPARIRTRIYELVLAEQKDIPISLVNRPKEISLGEVRHLWNRYPQMQAGCFRAEVLTCVPQIGGKNKHRPLHPHQGFPQTCRALRQETQALCLAEKAFVCHTRHLERTASGLASGEEGDGTFYHEALRSLGLGDIVGTVVEIVLDLGVAYSRCRAPAKIEWDAIIGVIWRRCRPDTVIKVVVTFDWTMVGAADRFSMSFEVGKAIVLKPADIEAAAVNSGSAAKLPFLKGYMLLRRLIGSLREFEVGERDSSGSSQR
ncbi:hypothetical protein DOTSEDRAFT_21916 [Dothistroma septosporum NZE10]|uniref:Uncharacterized protein n=1 Tax=Dothistroma septosporum (strain NZE10 / CBS 128990) TaxID=675120 RepID=N1Q169_DOTSN|nr:hypothetical protein DOTSEDRAFT_21916 [Dothistroma septosporum NZE10]